MVKVTDYNPEWAENFVELKEIYTSLIKDVKIEVEHVGSTSVPGLCAKPIIDVDIIYYKEDDFEKIKTYLINYGYKYQGDLGIESRKAFKYIGSKTLPKHHLYVCKNGILALENHIEFRNYLIKNPDAAKEYGKLKRGLAVKFYDDVDQYCENKTEFISCILAKCKVSEEKIVKIKSMNTI